MGYNTALGSYLKGLRRKPTPADVETAIRRHFATEAKRRLMRYVHVGDGCWEWTGLAVARGGYGKLNFSKVIVRAHRLSYILHVAQIPLGMQVCHHCDNTKCVRPDHLFLGSPRDNTRDMMAKGRQSAPPLFNRETHPNAKLSRAQIQEIASASGAARIVAARYGVCAKTVYRARGGLLE